MLHHFLCNSTISMSNKTKHFFQDANTFVPNSAKVDGTCRDGDAETFALSFKEFTLEWTFEKVRS